MKNLKAVYDINPALDFSFDQMDFIEDYTAMASLPLMVEEKLLGAVSLYSCELEQLRRRTYASVGNDLADRF